MENEHAALSHRGEQSSIAGEVLQLLVGSGSNTQHLGSLGAPVPGISIVDITQSPLKLVAQFTGAGHGTMCRCSRSPSTSRNSATSERRQGPDPWIAYHLLDKPMSPKFAMVNFGDAGLRTFDIRHPAHPTEGLGALALRARPARNPGSGSEGVSDYDAVLPLRRTRNHGVPGTAKELRNARDRSDGGIDDRAVISDVLAVE